MNDLAVLQEDHPERLVARITIDFGEFGQFIRVADFSTDESGVSGPLDLGRNSQPSHDWRS